MRLLGRLACLLLLLAGCGRDDDAAPIALQLNWKPEPQFGGFYAAAIAGHFQREGLEVAVTPGGAGTPTVQMIAAGTVPFGIVSADELIIARDRGADVVAVFAVYQTNPQGIMTPAARGLKSLEELFRRPGILAMQEGLPYSSFLKRKYGFDALRVVPSPFGDLSMFRSEPEYAMQCFVTSEPLAARRIGVEPATFLIAESGYNPYTTVLATSGAYLRDRPQTVAAVVRAVAMGWRDYLADPAPANRAMRDLNPTMDEQTFTESAAAQRPLIETDPAGGVGTMTRERWQTLAAQLLELKAIDKPADVEACFTTRFLPAGP